MKTTLGILVFVVGLTGTGGAAVQTLQGTITDRMCGLNHAVMPNKLPDRECTVSCTAKGAEYVLVADGRTYKLTNREGDLKTHAGHLVNLTGDVKGDTIKVSKVEMPKESK